MYELRLLEDIIGVKFKDPSLLQQAFIHSSYLNENPDFPLPSNERLEFLGDAVLGLVVAEELYERYPQLTEGELTRLRAGLVRRETLAQAAGEQQLGQYLRMGKGEISTGGREKQRNLSGLFEAVIGAIYLDQGLSVARGFILNALTPELETLDISELALDCKSLLQEVTQSRYQAAPLYHVSAESGPQHDREFTVDVEVKGRVLGQGKGKSKQAAEKEAAKAALKAIGALK